jgi:hypothetical protein
MGRGVTNPGIGGNGASMALGSILVILLVYENTLDASEILLILSFEVGFYPDIKACICAGLI